MASTGVLVNPRTEAKVIGTSKTTSTEISLGLPRLGVVMIALARTCEAYSVIGVPGETR